MDRYSAAQLFGSRPRPAALERLGYGCLLMKSMKLTTGDNSTPQRTALFLAAGLAVFPVISELFRFRNSWVVSGFNPLSDIPSFFINFAITTIFYSPVAIYYREKNGKWDSYCYLYVTAAILLSAIIGSAMSNGNLDFLNLLIHCFQDGVAMLILFFLKKWKFNLD
jgi:hypothetical protein